MSATRILFFTFSLILAQTTHSQVYQQGATFINPVDQELNIRYVAVLPVTDNLSGIYSRPIEEKLVELAQSHHRWDYRPITLSSPLPDIIELEQRPEVIKNAGLGTTTDAVIAAQIVKGPSGISIKMDLFLSKTGLLLTRVHLQNHSGFDIPEVQNQTAILFKKLIAGIPYQGQVLSRNNNMVTVNLGKKDGLIIDQSLSVVQIIGVERHPKFQFVVRTQKDIIGTIKILKVEDTLSFGSVVFERERGVVQKGAKLSGLEGVSYSTPENLDAAVEDKKITQGKLDNTVAFGKNASEWVPVTPPTFGQIELRLGVGSYNGKANLDTSGSLEAATSLYPLIAMAGEIWVTPQWTTRFRWEQAVASTANPQSGSPEDLSHSLSVFSMMVGYNFLLQDEFFGPKLEVSGGFSSYSDQVDDSSPTGLTSMKYSGLTIGLRGQIPVSPDNKWRMGLGLNFIFKPSMTETPVTSGDSSSNSVNDFTFLTSYQLKTNLIITSDLNFRLYRATFTGTGTRGETASNASQKLTTLSGGVTYMF